MWRRGGRGTTTTGRKDRRGCAGSAGRPRRARAKPRREDEDAKSCERKGGGSVRKSKGDDNDERKGCSVNTARVGPWRIKAVAHAAALSALSPHRPPAFSGALRPGRCARLDSLLLPARRGRACGAVRRREEWRVVVVEGEAGARDTRGRPERGWREDEEVAGERGKGSCACRKGWKSGGGRVVVCVLWRESGARGVSRDGRGAGGRTGRLAGYVPREKRETRRAQVPTSTSASSVQSTDAPSSGQRSAGGRPPLSSSRRSSGCRGRPSRAR